MSAERAGGPTPGARAVLDIGPHAGALVVFAPARLAGREVEIRRRCDAWRGQHTAIRARHLPGHTVYAGLFDRLAPGPYDLRLRTTDGSDAEIDDTATGGARPTGVDATAHVEITAGTVTNVDLVPNSSS